jgi:SAM-dependent methyltransferase
MLPECLDERLDTAMKEPYLSEFQRLVRAGAGMQDIHDSKKAVGYASRAEVASEAWVRREVGRMEMHQKSLLPILEQYVGRVHSILDAGCSTGGTTVAMALSPVLAAEEIVGIDPDELSLPAAEVRAKGYDLSPDRIRFQHIKPGAPFPLPDDHFDLTVCVSVLEFLTTAEARQALAHEIQRVTRPGGHIFLATPTPFRLREHHTRRFLGDYFRTDGASWSSTPWQIRKMFDRCTRIPLHRYWAQKAREKYGRAISWLPSAVLGRLSAWSSRWQRFLLKKT